MLCRCQGGEGIYAFSTKHAPKVFELVQQNIVQGQQGGRQENGHAEKEARDPTRQRAVSAGSKRRSPPKEALESGRCHTLPATVAVSGNSYMSESEVLQDKAVPAKPPQVTPHSPVKPAEGPPAETAPKEGSPAESPPAAVAQEIESKCLVCAFACACVRACVCVCVCVCVCCMYVLLA